MTLNGCLISFSSTAATMRAVASVPPPAPHGQMMVTGRLGQAWARAVPSPRVAAAPAATPPSRRWRRVGLVIMVSSLWIFAARIAERRRSATGPCAAGSPAAIVHRCHKTVALRRLFVTAAQGVGFMADVDFKILEGAEARSYAAGDVIFRRG